MMYGRKWDRPFNDSYVNYSRDDIPAHTRISQIIRIIAVNEQGILAAGGRKAVVDGVEVYEVPRRL